MFSVELRGGARAFSVVLLGFLTLALVSCKASDPPTTADVRARLEKPTKVLACATEAMKGQKFARFGNFGTGQVERTVTVSISDPSQALTP